MNKNNGLLKQRYNWILKWLLLTVLALLLSPLIARAGTLGDLTYSSDGSSITITDCALSAANISIPDTIDGLPVASISDRAFFRCTNLVNVAISDNVSSIGRQAFQYCSHLTNIVLPEGLGSIEQSTFESCTSLASITLPDSISSIGTSAFVQCSSLTNAVLGSGVTNIGRFAFQECTSLVSMEIPDSVTSIDDYAFRRCSSMTNLYLGQGITNIGLEAFRQWDSLPEILVDPENTFYASQDGILFTKDLTTLIQCPAGKMGSYDVPNTATNIGQAAFNNTSLTNVVIPDTVISIGDWVFEWSTSIDTINVDAANPYFSSTSGILFDKGQTALLQYPGAKTNTSYTIPDSVERIAGGAFSFSHLSEILIPNTVTNIGMAAFRDCNNLTSVAVPDSVIGELNAFWYCTNLSDIVIGQGITSFEFNAFISCSSIKHIAIPSNVTSIGYAAFQDCSSLTSLIIPENVTSIESAAFGGCTNLTSIIIPDSITSFGYSALQGCTSLESAFIKGNAPHYSSSPRFDDSPSVVVYYLPGTSGWSATFSGRPAVLWNPEIQVGSGYGATTNGFRFNITGTENIPIAVEACMNLAEGNWIPLQTGTLTSGAVDFTDPDWTNFPTRIYRIATP